MQETKKDQHRYRAEKHAQAKLNGTAKGYYLVRVSDGARFFINTCVDVLELEAVAETYLGAKHGWDYWDYWIDYSSGADVNGNPAWDNLDCTALFI